MSEQTSGAIRAWFKRVEPIYPELFNTAHAICGQYDQAEYALRSAILEVYLENADNGIGFREKLRSAVREEAVRAADGSGEMTWTGFSDTDSDPLARLAARETVETQRLLMLRYGVGFSAGRIAQLTGLTTRYVRQSLEQYEIRCRRSMAAQQRSQFDPLFSRTARRQLSSRAGVPRPSGVYRAFEAEASQQPVREHRVTRIVYRVLVIIMALICAVLFWLFAVLVQPPAIEDETPGGNPAQSVEAAGASPYS